MRKEILGFLRKSGGNVSGEEMSASLGVSRAAVWKQMNTLKEQGYVIESHPRRGYRLISGPDRVSEEEVIPFLKTESLGRTYYYKDQVDSTNHWGKELAVQGAPEGTVTVAEEQVGGIGRMRRGWFAPFGKGIWFSLILRPPFMPYEAPKITLMAAVSVAETFIAHGIPCQIKWPNDILINGKKLVGILTEMSAEVEGIHHVVIGIGINVNFAKEDFPEELQEIVTSLSLAKGEPLNRAELFADILFNLEKDYHQVLKSGFTEIFDRWRKLSATLNQSVRVIGPTETFEGVATELDESGALWVERTDGVRELVQAGDVSVRPSKK